MAKDIIGRRLRVGINRQDQDGHVARFLDSDRETFVSIDQFENGNNPVLALRRAAGTVTAPAIVAAGDILGEYEFYGYTNQFHACAKIDSTVMGAPAAGVIPDSDLRLSVSTAGARSLRVRVMPNGQTIMGDAVNLTEAQITANGKARLWVAGTDSHDAIAVQRDGNNSGGPSIYARKGRGTLAAPATVATGDEMLYLQGSAYTNQWHDNVGAIALYIDGAVTAGQRPGNRIALRTGKPNDGGPTNRLEVYNNGNIALNGGINPFGASSEKVIGVGNAAVVPTGNPIGGGVLYAEAGAGKWRGSGGTITTFGPADPHCPDCGSDFGWEFERPAEEEADPARRYLAVCLRCLVDMLDQVRPGEKRFIRRVKPPAEPADQVEAPPVPERESDGIF